jgi:hypothetical protein
MVHHLPPGNPIAKKETTSHVCGHRRLTPALETWWRERGREHQTSIVRFRNRNQHRGDLPPAIDPFRSVVRLGRLSDGSILRRYGSDTERVRRVIRRFSARGPADPVRPASPMLSAWYHEQTCFSLNHLVGAREQRKRQFGAKGLTATLHCHSPMLMAEPSVPQFQSSGRNDAPGRSDAV